MSRWQDVSKDDIEIDGDDINIMLEPDDEGNNYAVVKKQDMVNILLNAGWRDAKKELPDNMVRVIVHLLNNYGKSRILTAQHINAREVLEEDFIADECDFSDYDDENDCYWTPEGWYESGEVLNESYYLGGEGKITHWMPLPTPPEGGQS